MIACTMDAISERLALLTGYRVKCAEGMPTALSQTREPYTVIDLGGPVPDVSPQPHHDFASSRAIAEAALWRSIADFVARHVSRGDPREFTVYWRRLPELVNGHAYLDEDCAYGTGHAHLRPVSTWSGMARLLVTARVPVFHPRDEGEHVVWVPDDPVQFEPVKVRKAA